jgi:hypothetical protein
MKIRIETFFSFVIRNIAKNENALVKNIAIFKDFSFSLRARPESCTTSL